MPHAHFAVQFYWTVRYAFVYVGCVWLRTLPRSSGFLTFVVRYGCCIPLPVTLIQFTLRCLIFAVYAFCHRIATLRVGCVYARFAHLGWLPRSRVCVCRYLPVVTRTRRTAFGLRLHFAFGFYAHCRCGYYTHFCADYDFLLAQLRCSAVALFTHLFYGCISFAIPLLITVGSAFYARTHTFCVYCWIFTLIAFRFRYAVTVYSPRLVNV